MPRPSSSVSSNKPKPFQYRKVGTAPTTPREEISSKPAGKQNRSEYAQKFAISPLKMRPKLRNPISTWSTRNRSDILPSSTDRNTIGRRVPPPSRRWPWQDRAARSEIFENPRSTDANNNPSNRPNGAAQRGALQPRQRWPWQHRTQSSGIFLFGRDTGQTTPPTGSTTTIAQLQSTTINAPLTAGRKWPWQERAMASIIFNQPEEKAHTHRTYTWDQRPSHLFFQEPTTPAARSSISKQKIWPWQERARESLIFKPLPPKTGKGIWYPWDQRQSVFDDLIDPNAKFDGISRYNAEFVQKKIVSSVPAAGVRCYEGVMGAPVQQRRLGKKMPPIVDDKQDKNDKPKRTPRNETDKKQAESVQRSLSSSSDEKENQVPQDAQRKQTFTVLQDTSNNKAANKVNFNDNNLVTQFSNMGIKQENGTALKQIANIIVERPVEKESGRNGGHPAVINVQD